MRHGRKNAYEEEWNQDALAESVFMLGVLSFGIGLVTLLPVNQGAFVNDGKKILQLVRPGAAADGYAALMALGSYAIAGVGPRDWDPDPIARATSLARPKRSLRIGRSLI